jgi:hypothetical protein
MGPRTANEACGIEAGAGDIGSALRRMAGDGETMQELERLMDMLKRPMPLLLGLMRVLKGR